MTTVLSFRWQAWGLLLISALAWLVMILQHSNWRYLLPTALQVSHGSPWWSVGWMLSWLIMIVAMMLPPALPFIGAVVRLVNGRGSAAGLLSIASGMFVGMWMLAGLVLALASVVFQEGLQLWPWGTAHTPLLTGMAVFGAAAYQLSPLKRICLIACRSPTGLILMRWKPNNAWLSLSDIALRYGLVCVGCCWPLMAVTLLVGSLHLPVMVVVSLMMLAERLLPSVRSLIAIQAGFACGLGLLLIISPLQLNGQPLGRSIHSVVPAEPHHHHGH